MAGRPGRGSVLYYLMTESQFCRGTVYLDSGLKEYTLASPFSSYVKHGD